MRKKISNKEEKSQALTLAQQFEAKGKKEMAARFYRMAGEEAAMRYQNENALAHYQYALALSGDAQPSVRYSLLVAIEQVYALLGRPEERSQNLIDLATLADTIDDDRRRAEAALYLASFKLASGDFDDAISIARLATRIAELSNAIAAEAGLLRIWGQALLRKDAQDQAQSKLKKALSLARTIPLPLEEAHSLRYLGVVHEENGRYAQAQENYEQALDLYKSQQNLRGQTDLLNNLGKVAYDQGKYSEALRYWEDAMPTYEAIGDLHGRCRLLINMGAICMEYGRFDQAETYNKEAQTLSKTINLRFGECLTYINLGLIYHYQGKNKLALKSGKSALKIAEKMKSSRMQGIAWQTLGTIQIGLGKYDEALTAYWQSMAIWTELNHLILGVEARIGLVQTGLLQEDLQTVKLHLPVIMDAIESDPTLDGTESPFRIYLTTYEALIAINDSRAASILAQGYALLQERAMTIPDQSARSGFLQLDVHRQLTVVFHKQA